MAHPLHIGIQKTSVESAHKNCTMQSAEMSVE